MQNYDIFISYRREGGKELARNMKTELKGRGYNVFLDFDNLGCSRFDKRIFEAIDRSSVFLFILTPGCFDRCTDPDDWVRKEIQYAFDRNKGIIPVNIDGKFEKIPVDAPDCILRGIGLHTFVKVDMGDLYDMSVKKLVEERIAPVLDMTRDAASGAGAEIHIETDADCQVQRFHHELITAYAGKENTIWLKEGRHKLQFVSTEDDSVACSKVYTVENVLKSDYIEVELLSDLQKKRIERKIAGHDYVDLGLPSGTLWATCNVGASKPSDYGDYFAWGETNSKSSYNWKNLKYRADGDSKENVRFSKYVAEDKYGTFDNKSVLELSDDAAHAQWGGAWRMPTHEEWVELHENCDWEWTKQNGCIGYKVTSKQNGARIFLPAAGWRGGESGDREGVDGSYWSSSLYSDKSCYAFHCGFDSDVVNPSSWYGRYLGLSVRPVASSLQ